MKKHFSSVVTAFILCIFLVSNALAADEDIRKGKGELFLFGQSMSSNSVSGEGIDLEFDDTIVGGFGIGFNFSNYLNINLDLFFGSTDAEFSAGSEAATVATDISGYDINLDYNILNSHLTPLLTAGIGCINFNAEDIYAEETDFSYNAGAGLRFDIEKFFIKGIYRCTFTKMEDSDDILQFDGVSLFCGFVF